MLESAFPDIALARAQAPVMNLGGDRYTSVEGSCELFHAVRGEREIWLLDALSHDQLVSARSYAIRQKQISFLDRHLQTPT